MIVLFKLILYYVSQLGVNDSYLKFDVLNARKTGNKLNDYLVPPYRQAGLRSIKCDWGLGLSVFCTALRSDSDSCLKGKHYRHCECYG